MASFGGNCIEEVEAFLIPNVEPLISFPTCAPARNVVYKQLIFIFNTSDDGGTGDGR